MHPIGLFVFALPLVLAGGFVSAGSDPAGCAGAAAATPVGTQRAEVENTDVSGQILIRFDDTLPEADAARIIARIGAEERDRMLGGKLYLVEIPYPESRADIIRALTATPGVVYAEPNQTVSIPEPIEDTDSGDGPGTLIPLPKVD